MTTTQLSISANDMATAIAAATRTSKMRLTTSRISTFANWQKQPTEQQQLEQHNTHRKSRTRTALFTRKTVSIVVSMMFLLLLQQPLALRAEEESQDFQKNSEYTFHIWQTFFNLQKAAMIVWPILCCGPVHMTSYS